MSTTKTDTTQGTFAPAGMAAYNQLIPGFASTAQGYMQNPFSNPFFQTQQQLGTRQAQNLGGTNISNLLRNFQTGGTGGGTGTLAPFQQEMLQNQSRANTGLQAQLGFLNPVMNALGQQNFYSQLASQFRPLQTGGKSTESTGGLGTWLPQVAGMALGAATGGLGGGLGSFFGGGGSSVPTGGTSDMMNTAMSAFNNANPNTGIGSLPLPSGGYLFGGGGGGTPPPPMPGGGWMSS